jgi:hypothetical protein
MSLSMLNNLKKRKQSNISFFFLASLWSLTLPVSADTLNEAIQHSLITNPEVIFNSNERASSLFSDASSKNIKHDKLEPLLKGLALNQTDCSHSKVPGLGHDLSIQVVNHYLLVVYQEKRVEIAKANQRLYRMVF